MQIQILSLWLSNDANSRSNSFRALTVSLWSKIIQPAGSGSMTNK
ncbi:hypothetical protein EV14_2716 [Prochlorococcus sp. MIT 0703]|nr:hypothetical protein EV14_2716 [Prochlorococcus sp. MIT 0703]